MPIWVLKWHEFCRCPLRPDRHLYWVEISLREGSLRTPGWIDDPRSRGTESTSPSRSSGVGDDRGMVAMVDLQGNHKQLSGTFGSTQGLAWSPDQSEIWFSAVKNGIYRSLYATSLRGRERPLLAAPGNVDIQDVLPNGSVLLNVTDERLELMVFTPEHPEGRDFTWMDWAYGAQFFRRQQVDPFR